MKQLKHIVCYGDSNTHGYCADPCDTESGSNRFSENERWTCLLQKKLGTDYLVLEEGLTGRTTVVDDPLHESMSGLSAVYPILMSHEPVDLLIVMLGTNDCKERFSLNPACIAICLERLCLKAETVPCWRDGKPNILIVSPPHMLGDTCFPSMGAGSAEKSKGLAGEFKAKSELHGWGFLNADGIAEVNPVDMVHLSRAGHKSLADALAEIVPKLCV